MNVENNYLEELNPYPNSYVTFVDGARERIKSICKFFNLGFPCLDDVMLVKGLIANLIKVSQLCDQGLNVNFNKFEYIVSSKDQKVLMKGLISKDSYYLWISKKKSTLNMFDIQRR